MAYLKPSAFTQRVFNPIAMRLGLAGAETLAVRGRKSGKTVTLPVIPVKHEGERYLVSPRGETQWVRNLRTTGEAELRRRGAKSERFTVVEVPVEERSSILVAYREKAGRTVTGYFKQLPNDADHPTFRMIPESR